MHSSSDAGGVGCDPFKPCLYFKAKVILEQIYYAISLSKSQ
jgi:hypothetical protein